MSLFYTSNAFYFVGTEHMPQSLILNLVTRSVVPKQYLQGYFLQQLFFHLVDIVDPELGHVLRRDKQNRAYSLSALQYDDLTDAAPTRAQDNVHLFLPKVKTYSETLQYTHNTEIPNNSACWWRISFLDDALFDHLIFLWNQLQDEVFQLGTASVEIVHITSHLPDLDWASSSGYSEIYELASAYERDIHLQFVTPTAFELQGFMTPLPTVEAVFQPLRKAWNRYGGLVFSPNAISSIVPTQFDIQTETVQSIRRKSLQYVVGCTGRISFRILGNGDPLTIKRINTLADFARYCPVGCNTPLGMGVIRRFSDIPCSATLTPSYLASKN